MTRRLAAAIAGALVIVGVIAAYALGQHPMVAGSNKVAPLYGTFKVPKGGVRCQALDRVPAKAARVRVIATAIPRPGGALRVKIGDRSGPFDKGVKKQVYPGTFAIGLNRLTRSAHRAQICFVNPGYSRVVLAGERKRSNRSPGATMAQGRPAASVVFVRPHMSTWLARRDVIANRFENAQPGGFGGWSLWLALVLAVAGIGLALWWLVFRLEDDST
jgi:hypothetical protein